MQKLKPNEKIDWMKKWCKEQGLTLQLEGECGFGRECVGVISPKGDCYPDYLWYDDDYNEISGNYPVWTPERAYHKHECVAVLGRDEESISQLYEWLKWFDKNGFEYKSGEQKCDNPIELLLGRDHWHRMVKKEN